MAATTWDARTFAIDFVGTPLNSVPSLKPVPTASGKFQFVPSAVNSVPYLYTITPDSAGSIPPFWVGLKLLPQGGERLNLVFAGTLSLAKRIKKAKDEIAANLFQYERLVGFSSVSGNDDPVEFYQIDKGAPGNVDALLIVRVNLIGHSPNGIVAGHG